MAKGFKHGAGGGGAPLNFKVVGNPQPVSPKENTIWVNTDAEITGWIFSAVEPTEPTEGIVWFPAGTSQTLIRFNALKKNGIMVYPRSAKQYVSGAWAEVTAKIWQNDEWANWARYLFQSGKGPIVPLVHVVWNKGKASHTTDSIVHTRYDSGEDWSTSVTEDAVELSGYSMLYARAKCTTQLTNKEKCVGIFSARPTDAHTRPDIALTNFATNSVKTVYSLPIPSGIERAYVGINGNGNCEVYDIWME